MELGTVLIIGVILGVAAFIYVQVDTVKDIKKHNPNASKKEIFSQYVDYTIEEGERRKEYRHGEARKREEQRLKDLQFNMLLNGMPVEYEDENYFYFTGKDGKYYCYDKATHVYMEQY